MFHWYRRAAVCFVFLPDLALSATVLQAQSMEELQESIAHCRWFTRSWTLQELIAPLHIHFFNQDWDLCFTKVSASAGLAQITGIGTGILEHRQDLSAISVAQKISWAATQESTRLEDLAYSLLGIFEINMPLLYGEEERAFLRLQTEIISSCLDSTIFAWMLPEGNAEERTQRPIHLYSGALALSPLLFRNCADVESLDSASFEMFLSNRGIKLRAQFGICQIHGASGSFMILPVCRVQSQVYNIQLRNVGQGIFARQNPCNLLHVKPWNVAHRLVLGPFLLEQLPSRSLTPPPP